MPKFSGDWRVKALPWETWRLLRVGRLFFWLKNEVPIGQIDDSNDINDGSDISLLDIYTCIYNIYICIYIYIYNHIYIYCFSVLVNSCFDCQLPPLSPLKKCVLVSGLKILLPAHQKRVGPLTSSTVQVLASTMPRRCVPWKKVLPLKRRSNPIEQ